MTKTCPCGKPFTATRSDARFCSSSCRSAAHQGRLVVMPTADDPDAPDTTPVVILGELSSLRAEGVASRVAFDYVLVDREHSDPESTDLAAFRKTWDEERKP